MAQHSHAPRRVARPEKQNTFFGGAAILAVGIMVVKLIGMFYKIPLINIIGEQGSADFGNAYNIYAVLLTISTAGLPVAVSKLVSEANATGRQNQVRRVFRLSLALFLTLGVLSFLIMSFGSAQLAALMNDDQAAPGIRALAPAVICVGCLSAFRGYAQGHGNMTPTAVSQIIEALCKLVVGLGLAYWLVKAGADQSHAAAGAITGVTVGTIVALAYMLLNYLMGRSREGLAKDTPDSNATIIRNLLMIAVPITISSSMVGIVTVIDSSLVQGQLQRALLENTDCWALYKDFMNFDTLESALKAWQATLPEGFPSSFLRITWFYLVMPFFAKPLDGPIFQQGTQHSYLAVLEKNSLPFHLPTLSIPVMALKPLLVTRRCSIPSLDNPKESLSSFLSSSK